MPEVVVQKQREVGDISLGQLRGMVEDFSDRLSRRKGAGISGEPAHKEVEEFGAMLATCFCYQNKWKNDSGFASALNSVCGDFIGTFGEFILQDSSSKNGLIGTDIGALLGRLKGVGEDRPAMAAELLMAVHETRGIEGSLGALSDQSFMDSLNGLSELNASSLLYVVSITKNVTDLTDSRLFTEQSLQFLNALDIEPMSMWLYGMARSNGVEKLTAGGAIGMEMLDAINDNPQLAVWLSYLIGTGNSTVADQGFLNQLSGMGSDMAERYLVGFLLDSDIGTRTVASMIEDMRNRRDPFLDVPRKDGVQSGPSILLADLGDGHNFELALKVLEIKASGFNVIMLNGVTNPLEIARIAKESKVQGVGYGLVTDMYTQTVGNMGVVRDTQMEIARLGLGNLVTFAGGSIDQRSASSFEQMGITVLGHGALSGGITRVYGHGVTASEIITFLNSSLRQPIPDSISYSGSALGRTAITGSVEAGSANMFISQNALGSATAFSEMGSFDYDKHATRLQIQAAGSLAFAGDISAEEDKALRRLLALPIHVRGRGDAYLHTHNGAMSSPKIPLQNLMPGISKVAVSTSTEGLQQRSPNIAYRTASTLQMADLRFTSGPAPAFNASVATSYSGQLHSRPPIQIAATSVHDEIGRNTPSISAHLGIMAKQSPVVHVGSQIRSVSFVSGRSFDLSNNLGHGLAAEQFRIDVNVSSRHPVADMIKDLKLFTGTGNFVAPSIVKAVEGSEEKLKIALRSPLGLGFEETKVLTLASMALHADARSTVYKEQPERPLTLLNTVSQVAQLPEPEIQLTSRYSRIDVKVQARRRTLNVLPSFLRRRQLISCYCNCHNRGR